jgi:hypothetical protein
MQLYIIVTHFKLIPTFNALDEKIKFERTCTTKFITIKYNLICIGSRNVLLKHVIATKIGQCMFAMLNFHALLTCIIIVFIANVWI